MKTFQVYFDNLHYSIEAEKVEFDWNTRTAVFLVDGEVVGAAYDWVFIGND